MTSILYTSQKSKRKPANTAKRREQKAEWEALLKKYDVKHSRKITARNPGGAYTPPRCDLWADRSTKYIPSVGDGIGNALVGNIPQYTGIDVVGIAVMHKSCLQPVFSKESATDAARMRR